MENPDAVEFQTLSPAAGPQNDAEAYFFAGRVVSRRWVTRQELEEMGFREMKLDA